MCRVIKQVSCLKQGNKMNDFCLKQGHGLRAAAAHPPTARFP